MRGILDRLNWAAKGGQIKAGSDSVNLYTADSVTLHNIHRIKLHEAKKGAWITEDS